MGIRLGSTFLQCAAVAGVVALTPLSHAGPALTGWDGGNVATAGHDQVVGWTFIVTGAVTVSALGVWDEDGQGLANAHQVGIYRVADRSLTVSATVDAGTVGWLDGGFRYALLPGNVVLGTGVYTVVMTEPSLNLDRVVSRARRATTSAQIEYVRSEIDVGDALHFPDPAYAGLYDVGIFGPNFQMAAVPEPAAGAMLLVGLLGLGFAAKRREVTRA